MRSTTRRIVVLPVWVVLMLSPGLASPPAVWDLDPEFGMGGIVVSDFVGVAQDLVLQEDGKLVLGGVARLDGSRGFAAVRLLPDGTLDATFGVDGLTIVDFESGEVAYGMALQGGRVLLGGISSLDSGHHRMALVRLTSDGMLDETFGVDGVVLVHPSSFQRAVSLTVLDDGRIVAAGAIGGVGNTVFVIVRFHVDGALDESFGNGGVFRDKIDGWAEDAVVDPQGRTLVLGNSNVSPNVGLTMVRVGDAGQLDTSFGIAGRVFLPGPEWQFLPKGLALQSDGKIVAVGRSFPGDEGGLLVTRLLPAGDLDLKFGNDGFVTLGSGSLMTGTGVLVQDDGFIVLSGWEYGGNTSDFIVARLTPEGILDESFGVDGIIQTDLWGEDQALAAAFDGSGGILLAGRAGGGSAVRIGVARYRVQLPSLLEIPTLEKPLLLLLALLLGGVGLTWLRRSSAGRTVS